MKLVLKRFYDLGAHALNANTSIHIATENAWQKESTFEKRFRKQSIWGRLLVGTCHTRKADAMRAPRAVTFHRAVLALATAVVPLHDAHRPGARAETALVL